MEMSEDKVMNERNPELEQAKNRLEYLECEIVTAKEMLSESLNNCLIFKANALYLSKNNHKLMTEISNLKAELFAIKNNQQSTDAQEI